MGIILLLLLVVLVVGTLPRWRYSRGWGATPSVVLGVVLLVVLVLLFTGNVSMRL